MRSMLINITALLGGPLTLRSLFCFFVYGAYSHAKMVWTDGIIGGLFTYILFWTLVYAVVHIY